MGRVVELPCAVHTVNLRPCLTGLPKEASEGDRDALVGHCNGHSAWAMQGTPQTLNSKAKSGKSDAAVLGKASLMLAHVKQLTAS